MARLRRWTVLLAVATLAAGCAHATHSVEPPPSAGPQPSHPFPVAARTGSADQLVAAVKPAPAKADPGVAAAVATAEEGFGLRLLAAASQANPSGNLTVSPLSLDLGLTMLENGAGGGTLSEISRTLGAGSLAVARQDQGWAGLMTTLERQSTADQVAFDSANSLWLQKDFPMNASFMSALAQYFATGVWQVDFAQALAAANSAINAWVSQQTHGRITKLFAPGVLDPGTLLVLANAVYFHAGWQTPFDASRSEPSPFYLPGGGTATAVFMDGLASQEAITPHYAVARLPYTGGHYEADVIMPTGEALDGFAANLTPHQLASIIASAREPGRVLLPRFTTSNYLPLNAILSAMGMPTAFTSGANFSAMTTRSVQVQSVVQRDFVSVGEKGTEAAAATGISIEPSAAEVSPQSPVVFDHPFLFLVRNVDTGTLLFAGRVNNPAS
jgi:serpin B